MHGGIVIQRACETSNGRPSRVEGIVVKSMDGFLG